MKNILKIKHYYIYYKLIGKDGNNNIGNGVIKCYEFGVAKTSKFILSLNNNAAKYDKVFITFFGKISKEDFMEYTGAKTEKQYESYKII